MRALIPRFARLGSYLTLVTAPFVTSGVRLAFLVGNAVLALLVTFVVEHWHLLDQASDRQMQVLLLMYGALIANGSGLAGARSAPYLLMQALPVLFAAVFFAGSPRYWVAIGLAAEHAAILTAYGSHHVGYDLSALALCLIVAHFGAQVSGVLRESVAANRAMNTVLEATNADPRSPRLPEIGLSAAIDVVGWDVGSVMIRDGDLLRVAATQGISAESTAAYRDQPLTVDGPSMSADVVRSREPQQVPDAVPYFGPDSPLVRDGVRSILGVPIPYHGEILGVLSLGSLTQRIADARELDRVRQVAEQLGLALGNMRAYLREAQVAGDLRELNRRKDAFLATISHELRTPATTITLAARTLRDAGARLEPGDRAYAHDLLVRRSEELSGLIDSLLEEALAESDGVRLELTSVDWCADLQRWVQTSQEQTGRAVTLVLPEHPITTMADRTKVERIVTNLLSNAAKFSAAGTLIRCVLTADDEAVDLAVHDEGIGVPEDALDRIFEPFYQVEAHATRERGGFGIGLSLVRRFVEAHGGTVALASSPGYGSTFRVRLPRSAVPMNRTTPPAPVRVAG